MPSTERFRNALGFQYDTKTLGCPRRDWNGPMPILDLRQLTSRQLGPLLAEEAVLWRQELRWDYNASVELIKKFLDAHSLTGSTAIVDGKPAGYSIDLCRHVAAAVKDELKLGDLKIEFIPVTSADRM